MHECACVRYEGVDVASSWGSWLSPVNRGRGAVSSPSCRAATCGHIWHCVLRGCHNCVGDITALMRQKELNAFI